MMMRAYNESYLNSAMRNAGDMFDYAINAMAIPSSDFAEMLCASEVCRRIENAEPNYLIGKSGIDLALEIVEEITGLRHEPDQSDNYERSPEYWCGWALCYYQWYTACSYREIFRSVTFDELLSLYPTLHEADLSKFIEALDSRRRLKYYETNLKRIRKAYGCSQSELARKSGVSLRSIQMYEQRNKDINKAQAETILRLAKALGCSMEALYES